MGCISKGSCSPWLQMIHTLSIALDCGVYGKCGSVALWSVSKQVNGTWGFTHLCTDMEEKSILILGVISSWHTMGKNTLWGHCGDSDGVAIRPCLDHLAAPGNGESEQIRLQQAPARWSGTPPNLLQHHGSEQIQNAPEIIKQEWMGGWNSWIGKCTIVPFSYCFYKRCRFISVTDQWDQSPRKSQGNTGQWALINQWDGSSITT